MFDLAIEQHAPEGYKALVWEVFFVAKERGTSLVRHLPWIRLLDPNCWYVIARLGDAVVGGLCVKKGKEETEEIASLGLVCVAPLHRGQGLSTRLLQRAIGEARILNCGALRLWTGKPSVYQGHGFRVADNAQYGWIEKPVRHHVVESTAVTSEEWPDEANGSQVGLPPFASRGQLWRSATATLTTLNDEEGLSIAEWNGSSVAVVQLMEQVLPRRCRLNALVDDELPATLRERGWNCALKDSHLQMILPLSGEQSPQQLAKLHTARLLHRI